METLESRRLLLHAIEEEKVDKYNSQRIELARADDPRFESLHLPLKPQTKLEKDGWVEASYIEPNYDTHDEFIETKKIFFSFDRTESAFLSRLHPITSELQKRQMEGRQTLLRKLLEQADLKKERRLKTERLLWVMDGVLIHSLSIKCLFKVSQNYERIGMVPKDYL